ncbi:uncharacterized protein PSFLO_03676 [Pseudozyma flocculosa]|uniref:Uncharacterized protein n=1 Tax=Pseudozyma flocculosa TaxID=84751 RepID=A0A5C3F426_9BASI|nr:uncharacterized protein PSFLO_03676 [Pseudozyma flocculosa]
MGKVFLEPSEDSRQMKKAKVEAARVSIDVLASAIPGAVCRSARSDEEEWRCPFEARLASSRGPRLTDARAPSVRPEVPRSRCKRCQSHAFQRVPDPDRVADGDGCGRQVRQVRSCLHRFAPRTA